VSKKTELQTAKKKRPSVNYSHLNFLFIFERSKNLCSIVSSVSSVVTPITMEDMIQNLQWMPETMGTVGP
jgi:hypothetical protein